MIDETQLLTQQQYIVILLTWLGSSVPAFFIAAWWVWDTFWDWRAARRVIGRTRWSYLGHTRTNLFLATTFLFEAFLYVLVGVGVVTGSLQIILTGPTSIVVLVPPLSVITRVVALRFNRQFQRFILRNTKERENAQRTSASGS